MLPSHRAATRPLPPCRRPAASVRGGIPIKASFQCEMRVVVRDQDVVRPNVALYEGRAMQNRDRKPAERCGHWAREVPHRWLGPGEGRLGSGDKPSGSDRGDPFGLLLQLPCGLLEYSTLFQCLRKHDQDPACGKPIGDLLVRTLKGEEIARNERDIIQLHVASSECPRWSAKAISVLHRLVNSMTFRLFCLPRCT
jgi:hypothetical protein